MEILLFKSLLYISSYIPLIFMIFLDNMDNFTIENTKNVYFLNPHFWNIVFFFMLISMAALIIWLKSMKNEASSKGKKYKLNRLQSNDGEIMNYFTSYIIPILSLDIQSNTSIVMNLILIIVVGIYFIRNNNLHYNVLLIIAGYHIYNDEYDNIIISRKNLNDINNKALKADQIGTSNIFYI